MQNAGLGGHRQRQINELNAVLLDKFREFSKSSEQGIMACVWKPALIPVIKKTGQFHIGITRFMDTTGERCPLLVHAHDDGALWRTLEHEEIGCSDTEQQMGADLT